jgi:large subunit ribosomal protein L25
MSEPVITVEKRDQIGGGAARKLAHRGQIAAVVYGASKDTVPIQVDRKSLLELLKGTGSENAVFLLKMAGTKQERHAMIRDMQVDPVSRQILHIDFQRILMDQVIRVQVPVELVGTPEGVRNEGGILDFVTREVEAECLASDIPRSLPVDISHLHIGQHVEVHELEVPEKVTILEEPDRTLAAVGAPRAIAEPEEEVEEELLLEAEMEEPEVIGRGKEEAEEEAETEEG